MLIFFISEEFDKVNKKEEEEYLKENLRKGYFKKEGLKLILIFPNCFD